MNKSENTLLRLEAAFARILEGNPQRIPINRNLSLRAIEEEARLGNGSAYYYPDFVEKIKKVKQHVKSDPSATLPKNDIMHLKNAKQNQERIKIKYRNQVDTLRITIAQQAAEHHQLAYALSKAYLMIDDLKQEVIELRQQQIRKIK